MSNKIKVWYSCAHSEELGYEHIFTMDKDCLSCDAIYVTYFMTEYPYKLALLVEQYAKQSKEYVSIELFGHVREYWQGKLDYDSHVNIMIPRTYAVLFDDLPDNEQE